MKNSKKLELILRILICILIILMGVIGIYVKESGRYSDLIPSYTLGSDIKGATIMELEPSEEKDTIYYDKEGNEVDSSTITDKNKDDYEKKEIPVNTEESLNLENYKKSLDIMEKRLKLLEVDQYKIDLDEETGKVTLTIEDDYIEDVGSFLPMKGKLQLIDSKTEDVVLDYTDIKSSEASYASLTTSYVTYINLKLNASGIEKINNIDKYKTIEVSKEEKNEDNKEENEESKLIVKFDSDNVAEVSYDDIKLIGKTLRVTTASELTTESEINSQLNMDAMVCTLSTIGKMPVIYDITGENFMRNDMGDFLDYIVLALIVISSISLIILVFKHKLNGLFAALGIFVNISLFLIIMRLTKVQVSLNGFAGMLGLILLNLILSNNILNSIKDKDKAFSENIKNAYIKTLDVIVVILIIFIVFSFSQMSVINSMGLLLFWGWLMTILGNLIFTIPMLAIVNKK